jgi:hypothetical protein
MPSKARIVFDSSNTDIVDSNPARGIDVCPRFSLLYCPLQVQALWWAFLQSKESYQNVWMESQFRKLILIRNGPEGQDPRNVQAIIIIIIIIIIIYEYRLEKLT